MSKLIAFTNATIYTPQKLTNHALIVQDNVIEKIVLQDDFIHFMHGDFEVVDLKGFNISPGFIDLQVNGCGGADFNEKEENLTQDTLNTMLQSCYQHGTTTFLPTVITNPVNLRKLALDTVRQLHKDKPEIINAIPGLHIEGPHISLKKKGTHNTNFIKPIADEDLDLYLQNSDLIKMLTLAPEVNELSKVQKLIDKNILISVGHSNSTYEQAKEYFNAGVHCCTHLYNAMSSIENGRTPGLIGAIYDSNDVGFGIITDGVHVNWPLVNLSFKIRSDKAFVVTDAVAPAGTDITEFIFANKTIKVINEGCYDENGCLSGSAITMDSALDRLHKNTELSMEDVVKFATENPAKMIKMDHIIGKLDSGYLANLTVFDDDFNIYRTYYNGQIVYQAN